MGNTNWLWIVVFLLIIVALWKIFIKAGRPGWASIIPVYNIIVELQIIGKPVWWIFLLLIPVVNVVIAFIIAIELAKKFGKSSAFGFFLLGLFGFIGYPIIAFDDSKYISGSTVTDAPVAENPIIPTAVLEPPVTDIPAAEPPTTEPPTQV
jgi:hypothetical protein